MPRSKERKDEYNEKTEDRYKCNKRECEHTEHAIVPKHRFAFLKASRKHTAEKYARVEEREENKKRIENEEKEARPMPTKVSARSIIRIGVATSMANPSSMVSNILRGRSSYARSATASAEVVEESCQKDRRE